MKKFGVIVLLSLVSGPAWANIGGRIVALSGQAKAQKGTKEKPFGAPRMLKVGDTIAVDEIIMTSKSGTMKILLEDKSIIDLGNDTVIRVDQLKISGDKREVEVAMDRGQTRAAVSKSGNSNSQFRLRTQGATMGVRGTDFAVTAIPDASGNIASKCTVFTGSVGVATVSANGTMSEPVVLGQNQSVGVSASSDGGTVSVGTTQTLSQSEVSSQKEASVVVDSTFSASVTVPEEGMKAASSGEVFSDSPASSSGSNQGAEASEGKSESTATTAAAAGPATAANADTGTSAKPSGNMAAIFSAMSNAVINVKVDVVSPSSVLSFVPGFVTATQIRIEDLNTIIDNTPKTITIRFTR